VVRSVCVDAAGDGRTGRGGRLSSVNRTKFRDAIPQDLEPPGRPSLGGPDWL
jgi:hypothetical protein